MPSEKVLMRGSNVIGEAAILAGCRFFAGYPITPQNELTEHMATRMPQVDGTFVQGESEVASVNMIIGAAMTGGRVMTSSSSPGISLKQEGISYMAGMELPGVIVNVMRGGPGLGDITPSQSDYFQCTRGGGHGDYRLLVLAPGTVQELADLTYEAFELADKYRNPVMIAGDGLLGQMMEPVVLPDPIDPKTLKKGDWVIDGCKGREKRKIYSMYLAPGELLKHNHKLQAKYDRMIAEEQRWETYMCDDAEIIVVAYGTSARVSEGAINKMRAEGKKIGLFRPISLFPYPKKPLRDLAKDNVKFCVFEMSLGQMVEDVALSIGQRAEIWFHGLPSVIPTPANVEEYLLSVMNGDGKVGKRYEI